MLNTFSQKKKTPACCDLWRENSRRRTTRQNTSPAPIIAYFRSGCKPFAIILEVKYMNYREYNIGKWSLCTSDCKMPGGKPVYPVEIELTRSECEIVRRILEKNENAAKVRLNGEKKASKQADIMERLNDICACLMAVGRYNGSFIKLEEENELDALIICVCKVKGKLAGKLVKRLEVLRG